MNRQDELIYTILADCTHGATDMNQTNLRKIGCRICGKESSFWYYPFIDIQKMPWARQKIVSGSFFHRECPFCGTINEFIYPTLYHDRRKKILLRVSDKKLPVYQQLPFPVPPPPPPAGRQYCFRDVAGSRELAEKIRIFDAGLNDFKIEAIKLFLQMQYHCFNLNFLCARDSRLSFCSLLPTSHAEIITVEEQELRKVTDCFGDDFLYIRSYIRVNLDLIQQILLK